MSGIKFNDNEMMQIYMETNGQVTEYVFSNEISIHDERNIKQIFEETAKKIITWKLQEADKEFKNHTNKEQRIIIINEKFKDIEKAMINALKTKSNK